LRSLETIPNNLPEHLTSFVARTRELAEVAEALSQNRLLTLTGAGGCGKSRLALQVAAEALEEFPDGAWWVELAPLSDPGLVAPALAQAFGVRPRLGQSELDAVVSFLAARRILVLLDNCEHLLDEAARVAEALLRGCPNATVLATSREPLRIAGETDWRVPSLSLPRERRGDRPEDPPESSDAMQLFAERAKNVMPSFRLTGENVAAVARICRDLDGMPLAIELAAARLRVLSVEQIADGLGDRFRLLTGGGRSVLPRHRTLRASVEWSYELLSDRERRLFARLGVFVGGFTLEAVTHVGSSQGVEREEVFDLLTSLVDKSLVQADDRGAAVRYRLLETVRHYTLERLAEVGETEGARNRHRDFYLDLAEQLDPFTPPQSEFLYVLDPEAANFAHAIEWAADTDPDKALRLCVALIMWWRLRGHFAQGEAGLRRALEAARTDPSFHRAAALVGRGFLLIYSGAIEAAIPATYEALAEAERVGDSLLTAGALYQIGILTLFPDPVGSRPTLERARALALGTGHDNAIMGITVCLAYSYSHQDDHRRATALFDEVLPLAERTHNQEMLAWYWAGIAWAEHAAGALEACRQAAERALEAARRAGDIVTEVGAAWFLASADIDAGNPERALEGLSPVRERALARGGSFVVPWLEEVAARACAAEGRLEDARRQFESLIQRGGGGIAHAFARAHIGLAEVFRLLGQTNEAGSLARVGFETAQRIENPLFVAQAKLVLGRLEAARLAWTEAQRLHHEALFAIEEGGYRLELPRALEGLAEVATGLESHPEAARILGAAERARRDLGLVAWKHQRYEVASLATRLRDKFGGEPFEQAFGEGEALSLDEAVAYVRRARGARKRPSAGWESLTPTELEVVRHAASGLTNPEIGARMFLSRGTVRTHLSHIYAKLGVKNRSELAAEAARRAGAATA
jgi:predicted ATPase/DNA-binding CsgD family transcriptional regulator